MRVGVLPNLIAAHAGGAFTFERELLDQLLQNAGESEHRFVMLCSQADLGRRSLPDNVEMLSRDLNVARFLRRRGPRARFDRMIAHSGVDVVWALWPFHPVPDVPYITIVWDLQHRLQPFFPEVSAGGEWEAREREIPVRLRRAAAVIAGTEAGRREISAFYQVPEQRIHVLPHPAPRFALEAGPTRPEVLARFGLPEGYLFYPAQFWPHKNHVNLLLALRLLRDQGLTLPLVLVGSDQGNAGKVREAARRLGLDGQVHFLGFVSVEEMVALYRGASCLAYASLFGPENFPPLEAFALGCPVVAADVSGAREQLGDAALLVDATRPPLLAEALRRVREDRALRDGMVARGQERARRWTGQDFVRGVFAVLDGLVPYVRCWRTEGAG
jgi:glycosyltransferase involved in cell wall biosynthesis